MNPELLLQHFDRISEAPDAIPRLRRFILDLAVRGKLVEQDPNDEPASELLKWIQAEKARLVKKGKIKKEKSLPALDEFEAAFAAPANWAWSRLGEIGDWGSGSTPPRGNSEYYGGDINWLKSGELGDSLVLKGSEEKVTSLALQKCSFRLNQPGDVLIAMYGATIGKLAILAEPAVTNQAVCGCTPIDGILNRYLFLYLLSRREDFYAQSEGGAQPNISKIKIVISPFPLPPLAEQHRIVVKVDELMALCDQLEAAKTEREQSRDRLVAASLHRLNSSADTAETDAPDLPARQADAFRDHARFAFNHLPRLTTRPEHIKQLRQTILNLAVRGKLVPQDPNDEPVGELLNRVTAERQSLIVKGRLKAQKSCVTVDTELSSQPIPATWKWVRLADLISFGPQNGISPKPTNNTESPKALTLTATTSGAFDASHYKHVDLREVDCQNYWLSAGDVLFQRGNTREYVGIAAVFDGPEKSFVFPDLMIRVRFAESLSLRFIHMTLISPLLRSYFSTEATGASSSMPKISQGVLLNAPIPLPSLSEQHRIVARVDELMVLCDQLEAQLTTTEADSRRLLEAVLHDALHPPLAATKQMKLAANV